MLRFHFFSKYFLLLEFYYVSAKDFTNQLKIPFLLSKVQICKAFNNKSLKFMLYFPIS